MNRNIIFYSIFTFLVVLTLISFFMNWISSVSLMIGVLCLIVINLLFRYFTKKHA